MAELIAGGDGGVGGACDEAVNLDPDPLRLVIPKSEPLEQVNQEQFEFDLGSLEPATVRSLLRRVGVLESQIRTCLESQPLLYRVFDKVNALEQRIKVKAKVTTNTVTKVHLKRAHKRRRRFLKSKPTQDPNLTRVTRSGGRNLINGSKEEEDLDEGATTQAGNRNDDADGGLDEPNFLGRSSPITTTPSEVIQSQVAHVENLDFMDVTADEFDGGDDFDPLRSDQSGKGQEDSDEDGCNHAQEDKDAGDQVTKEEDDDIESNSNPKTRTSNKLKTSTATARYHKRKLSTSASAQLCMWFCTCTSCDKKILPHNLAEHEFYHRFDSATSSAVALKNADDLASEGAVGQPHQDKKKCLESGCNFEGTGRTGKRAVYRHYRKDHPTCALLRPYGCKVCPPKGRDTAFKTQYDLAKHYIQKHPIANDFNIEGGPGASKLSEAGASSGLEPLCTCTKCGKQFKAPQNLRSHIMRYHDQKLNQTKPFACPLPECGKRFLKKWSVDLHMFRVHTGGPFKCSICSREFKHAANFTRHERVHTGERRYPCPFEGCGKRFVEASAMRIHSLLHTGKPYTCDECGWQFQTEQHLRSHKKNHDKGTATAGHVGVARRRNL